MGGTVVRTTVAVVATFAFVAPPMAARAQAPQRYSYDDGIVSSVDTETCAAWGFDLQVVEHEYGTFALTFDDQGNFLKGRAQVHYLAWISANGKTLVERDIWNNQLRADGSFAKRGLTVHVAGPSGGIVVRDAGRIIFDPDHNIVEMHGPHDQLSGLSFCPALA